MGTLKQDETISVNHSWFGPLAVNWCRVQQVWEKFKNNDYIAFSCDCHDGPTVDRLPQNDQAAVVLKSGWARATLTSSDMGSGG